MSLLLEQAWREILDTIYQLTWGQDIKEFALFEKYVKLKIAHCTAISHFSILSLETWLQPTILVMISSNNRAHRANKLKC
jgi:hypothetical protein